MTPKKKLNDGTTICNNFTKLIWQNKSSYVWRSSRFESHSIQNRPTVSTFDHCWNEQKFFAKPYKWIKNLLSILVKVARWLLSVQKLAQSKDQSPNQVNLVQIPDKNGRIQQIAYKNIFDVTKVTDYEVQ